MGLSQKLLFIFFFSSTIALLIGIEVVESSSRHHHQYHGHHERVNFEKLFVIGDSYVDTGNNPKIEAPWHFPYGITFPGKSSGRYSDGRVFTDYLAKYLGLKSPIPYKFRKNQPNNMKYGINFAFGGSGVFETLLPYPNMTTQIQFFEQLIKDSVFKPSDLQNAIVHVSLSGNDYNAFLTKGGPVPGLLIYIPKVVRQLAKEVEKISKLGVKKISVATLQPLGCLPGSTAVNSYQRCNNLYNKGVLLHNRLLRRAINRLNKQATRPNGSPKIVAIDLYKAFNSIIHGNVTQQGGPKFKNLFKSCCTGIGEYFCSNVDEKGNKMYTLCEDPNSHLFWDKSHPTQAGWEALMIALQSNLEDLHR